MVGVFAGLKWRLVTSRIRTAHGAARAWMIVGWCVGAVLLVVVVLGLAQLRTHPTAALVTVTTLFSAQFVSWGLAPLVAFGVDETVDPTRFALLPLRPRTLQAGLLTTALIGYLPAANALLLVGAAIALSSSWWMLLIALPCVAAQLLLCVLFSRALSTAMSTLMAGRRGRDLGVMVGFGVFVLYLGMSFTLNRAGSSAGVRTGVRTGVDHLAQFLQWGPPGALAALPFRLAGQQWTAAAVGIVTVILAFAALWWWWSAALVRTLTTAPSTTSGSAPARDSRSRAVAGTTTGTALLVISRDRLLAWRDPMRRVPWLIVAFLSIVWPLLLFKGTGAVFGVVLASLLAGSQAANQYGTEGSALWLHLVAYGDRTRARGEALGHAAFAMIPGTVIVAIACPVLAAVRHEWRFVPAALGMCLAAMAGSAATAGYLSARLPSAARQTRTSMMAGAVAGQKGRTAGASLLIFIGGLLVAAVPGGLAVLTTTVDPLWGWAALLVGPAVGLAALVVMTRRQADLYLASGPEILAVVAVGDRV